MNNSDRAKVVLNGAIVLFVGLLCGYPTVVESMGGETVRLWHTAHEALIMIGVWMLAASSVFPVLVLARREALALVWSFLAMGYGFMIALVIGGITGLTSFNPGSTAVSRFAFFGSVIGIIGSMLATGLIVIGARAALKNVRADL